MHHQELQARRWGQIFVLYGRAAARAANKDPAGYDHMKSQLKGLLGIEDDRFREDSIMQLALQCGMQLEWLEPKKTDRKRRRTLTQVARDAARWPQ